VQVWHGAHNVVWHGVQRHSDTLTGIPFHRPLDCRGCREALPVASVDSLRFGSLERVGWLVAASPWVLSALLLIYFRATWGSD
jgi:hypothetical protein